MYLKIKNYIADKIKRSRKDQFSKRFDLQPLDIEVMHVSPLLDRDPIEKTPPTHVTSIKLSVKNKSDLIQDISFLDFSVYNAQHHKIEFYRYADGLGNTIEPEHSIVGYLYVLCEATDISEIEYEPLNIKIKVDFNALG